MKNTRTYQRHQCCECIERLRAERDQAREECGHEKHMRKFASDELGRFIAAKMRAEADRDRLAAALDRVRELADRLDRHTEVESEAVEACDPDGSWYDVSDAIRAAIEGTDS